VSEVLLRSCFDDKERIKTHLKQAIMYAEEAFVSGGETLALDTAATLICSAGAIDDNITGYTSYLRMKELLQRLDTDADEALCEILRLAERIISKDRLTVTVVGMDTATLAEAIVSELPSSRMGETYKYLPYEGKSIGYAIPGRVSYAVAGAYSEKVRDMLGTLRIARHILSYEYLWNTIRVQGGAYGAGFVTRKSGEILYYSYRDPSPGRSLECYKNAPAALRAIASSGMDLTDYIIGAVGEYDILLSPRLRAMIAADRILAGWSAEDEDKLWRDMISTDSDALLRVADLLEELSQAAVQVVVGPESRLAEIDGVRDDIRRI
jgi:Zn-dependent M16 (insulinase) family peptidase